METAYTVKLEKMIKELPSTSAWKRGVKDYAYELLDTLEDRAQMGDSLRMKASWKNGC